MLATFSQKPAPTAGSEVPDLRGLDARAAVALATRSGFRVRASGGGVVQTQQPLPGGALPDDHQVALTLPEGARRSPANCFRLRRGGGGAGVWAAAVRASP